VARLGFKFGRAEDPFQALQDHAETLKEEFAMHQRAFRSRGAFGGRGPCRTLVLVYSYSYSYS
jgi:hypothetical protein